MYFSDINGINSFNLNDFKYIGVGNTYSNTISTTQSLVMESTGYINKFYNYDNSVSSMWKFINITICHL
jgi:hypothetical protein